jgi:hypothetical protein
MNIKEKIKVAKKCYVWLEANDDGKGFYIQVSKTDLLRAVTQNWLNCDGSRFRITKEHENGRYMFLG